MEVMTLLWPVDCAGAVSSSNLTHLVSVDMGALDKNTFVEHQLPKKSPKSVDQLRVEPIVRYYLLSIADVQSLLVILILYNLFYKAGSFRVL